MEFLLELLEEPNFLLLDQLSYCVG